MNEPEDVTEQAAIAFALGLAGARVVSGVVETLFPKLFLRVLGTSGAATPGAALGFRMKGGRDLAVGVATLVAAARGDRRTVAGLTSTGIVIDLVDGLAVAADAGESLRRPVHPWGAWLGYVVAVGAGVAGVLLTPRRRRR